MRTERGRTLRAFAGGGSLALAALLTLAACGGAAAGLAAESAAALHEQVAAVRAAADTDDRAAADAAVDAFRAKVRRLTEAGELSPAEAMSLLEYADQIGSGVDAEVTATPTPASTETAPPTGLSATEPAAGPAPTLSPQELRAAQQEMADRITALLRERIQERIREQAAEDKAAAKSDGKKSKKSGHGDRDGGEK